MAEPIATILVVEDDIDVAEMLTAYFRAQKYKVLTANCGKDAVRIGRAEHPDLIILDIRLPDIDGYEVASMMRSYHRTMDIPIIFLTEKRDRSDVLQGLEVGGDDYITKPFDIQELRLRVRNALRRTEQGPLTNPVTGLAEGVLVDERLKECLESYEWALLLVTIENLNDFREAYGFVASDDVQKAISLMIYNAVRSVGNSSDFVGQLSATQFVIVMQPGTLAALMERIRGRLEQSLDYFYPLKDRGALMTGSKHLNVRMATLLASDGPFKSLEELKNRLMNS